jgi:3',5'-cyclic AMP phosphodiesterase CpdA
MEALPVRKIAHLSDIHFGRIAHPRIVGALVEEVNGRGVDLVVVSGDLTQRARTTQFQEAAAMLAAFSAPTLVVPGNHDVYAWWYPVSRWYRPLSRYRRLISADLAPTFQMDGLAVLGINSAHGRTVKGGKIGLRARHRIETFFRDRPEGTFKVLVVHHHLRSIQALGPHDIARNAEQALETAIASKVDLILCGHLHVSHVEPVEVVPARHRLVIATAGTATSNRGRGTSPQSNFYNFIEITPGHFSIEERLFDPATGAFSERGRVKFGRAFE